MVVIVSEHLILDFYLVFGKKKAMAGGGLRGALFFFSFFLLQSINFMISLFYVSLLNYNYHSLFYWFRSRV